VWVTLEPSQVSDVLAFPLSLDAGRRVRYLPYDAVRGSSGTLTWRAWDQSTQFVETQVTSAAINGGRSAFSVATRTARIVVGTVCDAFSLGSTCACYVPSHRNRTDNPLQLDVLQTKLVGDNLRVVFRESLKYVDTAPFFGAALASQCMDHFTWTSEEDEGTCSRLWTGVAAWNKVYNRGVGEDDAGTNTSDCRIVRTVNGEGNLVFTVPFAVRNKELLDPVRNTELTRRLRHSMPFSIVFPTRVEVTSGAVDVFSPVLTLGAVIKQSIVNAAVPGVTPRAEVEVFSSLQWPFRFKSTAATWSALPVGVSAATGADAPTEVTRAGYVCADGVAGVGSECAQVWRAQFSPVAEQCRIDGTYELSYELECRAPRNVDCPIDATTRVARFRFALASSSFCTQVADEIGLAASMSSYLEATHQNVKDDFLDGQVVYFQVYVSSDKASIARTSLYELMVTKRAGAVAVLELDLMNVGVATTLGTQMELTPVAGGATGVGGLSVSSFSLRLKTGAAFLNIAQDGIETVDVTATMLVQYANAGQVTVLQVPVGSLSSFGNARGVAEAKLRVVGGVRAVDVDEEKDDTKSGAASSTGGIASSAFAGVVVALAAAVVMVAAVAVVALRRRARSGEAFATAVELSSSSAASLSGEVEPGAAGGASAPALPTGMSMTEIHTAYTHASMGESGDTAFAEDDEEVEEEEEEDAPMRGSVHGAVNEGM
jgi:hypothetical protein